MYYISLVVKKGPEVKNHVTKKPYNNPYRAMCDYSKIADLPIDIAYHFI